MPKLVEKLGTFKLTEEIYTVVLAKNYDETWYAYVEDSKGDPHWIDVPEVYYTREEAVNDLQKVFNYTQ